MTRILVTGASGFVGKHLTQYLLGLRNVEVFGMCRRFSFQKCVPGVREFHADLLSPASLRKAFRKIKPHRVYHLAGKASVAASLKNPRETFRLNVDGTKNLLEAALAEKCLPRIHIAGSAEVYGNTGRAGRLLTENSLLRPINPYAVSKLAQEFLARQYFLSRGLPIVCTRAFIHIGPGQSEHFVASSFARQSALIALGLKNPEMRVGNLKAVRDFTDVRDVARAYYLALEKGRAGQVYNICTGKPRKVEEILRFYLDALSVRIRVFRESDRSPKADVSFLAGNSRKLRELTGWRPRHTFGQTLNDLLVYWTKRIRDEKK